MRSARWVAGLRWCCLAAVALLAAGCGQAQTHPDPSRSLPGGTYASQAYHFSITYPSAWALNATGCASGSGTATTCDQLQGTATVGGGQSAIPLQITITRAGQSGVATPGVSSLTITVMDLRNTYVAQAAAALSKTHGLQATTVGGQSGYVATPIQQSLPGSQGTPSTVTETHTDYYVVHSGYEYQISVDAVSGDNSDSALAAMLHSFTLTA